MRPALNHGEVCPTRTETVSLFDFMTPTGKDQVENEKCQTVNVWTKSLRKESRRPVIVYAWTLPVFGGITSYHTGGDLPFMLDNVDTISQLVEGKRREADKLASEASSALVRFATKGSPGERGKLDWPAYDRSSGYSMVFDTKTSARKKHDEKLLELIAAAR